MCMMPYSLTPELYAQFLCALFDAWYRDWRTITYVSIQAEEVARIHSATLLHDHVDTAGSGRGTSSRRATQK